MKPWILFLKASLVIGLLAFVGGTVPSSRVAAAANSVSTDPASISKQVQHQLAMLPFYGVFDNLAYQVDGTQVTLTGQLVSEHDTTKSAAVAAVKRIPGVTIVVDQIEVLPVSTLDDRIRRAEFRSIFSKSDLGRYTMGVIPQLHIIVRNGHVFLEGVVMNQMDKTVADMAAKSVGGVFSVTNNLLIG